jgi:hypothetical protein
MARYKVLKSVAHNFAHSFASVMNYVGRDYAMCHLIRRAKLTGIRRLRLDLLERSIGPVEMLSPPVVSACAVYCERFPSLVSASGAALDMVSRAELDVRIAIGRVVGEKTKERHGRVTVTMRIKDDRGRTYVGKVVEQYPCASLR